jgi:hypothetical protein
MTKREPTEEANDSIRAAHRAIEFGGRGYGNGGSQQFDKACIHVINLLEDAVVVYGRGSHGTATFLALTALEEIAKAELFVFRRGAPPQRGRDPLEVPLVDALEWDVEQSH